MGFAKCFKCFNVSVKIFAEFYKVLDKLDLAKFSFEVRIGVDSEKFGEPVLDLVVREFVAG